jgi:hypothetical protein
VKNGVLQRKVQWLSADKTQKGIPNLDKEGRKPGPGHYQIPEQNEIDLKK